MLLYLLVESFSYAQESFPTQKQSYVGIEARRYVIEDSYKVLNTGIHTQLRTPSSQPSFYFDFTLLTHTAPDDDLKESLKNIIDATSSGMPDYTNLENLSWQSYEVFASIGSEMPLSSIGEKVFWRIGGECNGTFEPGMYHKIQDQLSLSTDFTNQIRFGVFLDVGNEMTIGKSKISYSLVSAYLTGIYTSGGSLRDANSGLSLEDFNNNNGTGFTHASFANNQYFIGTEFYYHTPQISVFLNTKIGKIERSKVSQWYAEEIGTPIEARTYQYLGIGLGRVF